MEEAHERKKAKYSTLLQSAGRADGVHDFSVKVSTRGFVGSSTARLLKELGLRGKDLHNATQELSEEAAKASF